MLRLYDEFLEDETILSLHDRTYRLHVNALLYCARNLTDGVITGRGLKVLEVLLGFRAARHVVELVAAGLWLPEDDGHRIRNYLEFNPTAATVKAERAKARQRMRELREKRSCSAERSPERSEARDGERSPAVPYQTFPESLTGSPTAEASLASVLPINEHLVGKLVREIGSHGDERTERVVRLAAQGLPDASLGRVLESLQAASPRNRAAYAVAALKSERVELAAR